MSNSLRRAVLIISAVIAGISLATPARADLPNCTIAYLQNIAPTGITIGPITNPFFAPSLPGAVDMPPAEGFYSEHCLVSGTVVTNGETGKTANFAAFLPINWNGKYLFVGCESFCGVVKAPDTAALGRGYAVVTTDDGHAASQPNVNDGSWALTATGVPNTEALTDYFGRAVHAVTLATKQLIENWYTNAVQRSYFEGCYNGGREGMVEATRYPADFDGMVLESPTVTIRQTTVSSYAHVKPLLKSTDSYIPLPLLTLVDQKIYEQCDALDGVVDGLIQNPGKCAFRPESLLCKSGETQNCLTADQVATLNGHFNAATDPHGLVAAFGFPVSDLGNAPGDPQTYNFYFATEVPRPPDDITAAEPWGDAIGPAGGPFSWRFADRMLRYFVYRDANFNSNADFPLDFSGVVSDRGVALVDRRTEAGNGDDPEELSRFFRSGRKLILYEGYSNGAQSPFTAIHYYEQLAKVNGGLRHLQNDVRLFMAPGMSGCLGGLGGLFSLGGGPGPNWFDRLAPLENWVENAVAPEGIVATKYVGDNPPNGVTRTMPLCKYPEMARYRGSGDVNDAANWSCPSEDKSLLDVGPNGIAAGLRRPVLPTRHHEADDKDNDH